MLVSDNNFAATRCDRTSFRQKGIKKALTRTFLFPESNRADQFGNAQYLGPDPYFDDLFCMAADRAYVSTEQVVDTAGLTVGTPVQRLLLNRMMVTGVVETPNGAHFTNCVPDYERDERFQKAYAAAASGTDEEWAAFEQRFLSVDEAAYQAAVAAFAEENK